MSVHPRNSNVDANITRAVTCELVFSVSDPVEIVLQVLASQSAGQVSDAFFEVLTNGKPPSSVVQLSDPDGGTMHVVGSRPGRLSVTYRARIRAEPCGSQAQGRDEGAPGSDMNWQRSQFRRQVYLRPSRYCPSDHLVGFAVAEFGNGPSVGARVAGITDWIGRRIGYVPGSSDVHDSAEDTLLTGVGTCRDFAHLGVALCRATGVPARFAAVYAPGLSPMEFHAVFEAFQDGHWCVYDPTGLAPRSSFVRISTGRDAADTAFAAVNNGAAELSHIEVSAIAEPYLPIDDRSQTVELA